MQNIIRSGTVQTNNGAAPNGGAQSISGSGKVGNPAEVAAELGAGSSHPQRVRPLTASENSPCRTRRPVGGQASLGLFGCGPSITGKARRSFQALAQDQARRLGWSGVRRRVLPSPSFMLEVSSASDMREAFPAAFDADDGAGLFGG